jgi:hypothetical protein
VPILQDYLTEAELAVELEKTRATLANWRRRHKGPPYTFNGVTPIYPRAGVVAWLEAGLMQPARAKRRA